MLQGNSYGCGGYMRLDNRLLRHNLTAEVTTAMNCGWHIGWSTVQHHGRRDNSDCLFLVQAYYILLVRTPTFCDIHYMRPNT